MPRKKIENNDGQLSLFDPKVQERQKVIREISKAVVLSSEEHKDEPCIVGIDKNLINIHFFGLSTTRTGLSGKDKSAIREKTVIFRDQGQEKKVTVTITGNPRYGLPTVNDLDYALAFFEMLREKMERGEKLTNPIALTDAELRKAAGKAKNGRVNREIEEWISRMTYVKFSTTEEGLYDSGAKKWTKGIWGFFTNSIRMGEKILQTGQTAEMNYLWLDPWLFSNLLASYFRYIRHDVYIKLRAPLAKLLLPMFEVTFYASKGRPIARKYEEFCREYDLQEYEQVSRAKETFDPAFHDLKAQKVLNRWEYRCFPDTKKVDCLVFWPGPLYTHGPRSSGVIGVTPSQVEPAVSAPTAPQEEPKRTVNSGEDSGDERLESFIRFLQEEGVSRAKQLVKRSPHPIELLEVLKEEYLGLKRLAKEGKFRFERGEQAWLAWAVGSKDYQRPKGMMTSVEKKEEQKEREARVRAIAQKIQNKEFTHVFSQGKWYPIDGLFIDFPDFQTWHIVYGPQKRKQNKFVALLREISEDRFGAGGQVEQTSS